MPSHPSKRVTDCWQSLPMNQTYIRAIGIGSFLAVYYLMYAKTVLSLHGATSLYDVASFASVVPNDVYML